LIGPLLQFENLFGENFEELFDFYLKCSNHFTIQKLIAGAYYFNRISEEITPYFKFLVQLLDNEFKCRSFNITAECFRLIYFVNDVLRNLSMCLKPIFQFTINFNLLASKRQVFRQTFDDSKKPFLSEYVKGDLRLTSNVRFWLDYIIEREELSDNLFSISSLTNQNISNRGMIEQAYGWFGSIFPRGCTKLQFLRMFAGYFVERILKVYWKQKAEFLVGEVDIVDFMIRNKVISFLVPLTSKYQYHFAHQLFDRSRFSISFRVDEVPALFKFMLNLLPKNHSVFTCKIFLHGFAPDQLRSLCFITLWDEWRSRSRSLNCYSIDDVFPLFFQKKKRLSLNIRCY
jgi:hypothetical protein